MEDSKKILVSANLIYYQLYKENILEAIINESADIFDYSIQTIKDKLTSFFAGIRENLYVIVEYPYVDKVFRDKYYNYFSTKHTEHKRNCIRLSFFEPDITLSDFRSVSEDEIEKLQKKFMGFLILRPLESNIIGRSMISPMALKEKGFNTCLAKSNILLNGVKFNIKAFPHSPQDREICSCAETSIWCLVEYYSLKYSDYNPAYPSKIINILSRISPERLVPSSGLSSEKISFTLKEMGFGTKIYSRKFSKMSEFSKNLFYYLESGIPVIATLSNNKTGHAIVLCGRKKINPQKRIKSSYKYTFDLNDTNKSLTLIDYTGYSNYIITSDDNLAPYTSISISNPSKNYTDVRMKKMKFANIIVPLYHKIYIDAPLARSLIISFLKKKDLGIDDGKLVMRLFLASSRTFKNSICKHQEFDHDLAQLLIITQMPKFVWIAELIPLTSEKLDHATGLFVLDATEKTMKGIIFAGYKNKIFGRKRDSGLFYESSDFLLKKFLIFSQNSITID